MSQRCVAVAYSGGRDSTALLHATLHEAALHGVHVLALHVHHGLSENADSWLAHCQAQCARWARRALPVKFMTVRLQERPAKGESVEAWARVARYAALREMALSQGVSIVLLAHHRRDQAETVLLQALRGAGVSGLSGMPRRAQREGITWERPWLNRSRAQIDAYVRKHRLKYIEDDSNVDPRFARNRLRLLVWPSLHGAFDDAETSLAMAADWARDASQALEELADLDLRSVATQGGLKVAAWMALSVPRRANVLRTWIKRQGMSAPASLITRMLDEAANCRSARWPLGAMQLALHRDVIRLEPAAVPVSTSGPYEAHLCILKSGVYALPGWCGELHVEPVKDEGVPLAWLAHVELRARAGAEQFQAGFARPPRSLKKQYQNAGLAMWQRTGPLIYSGGQLVFVPGLGLDARVIGFAPQQLVKLHWQPLSSPV